MMIKVEAIVREEKFEDVKAALNEIEVNGITVSQVMGCGAQRGYKEIVRGSEIEIFMNRYFSRKKFQNVGKILELSFVLKLKCYFCLCQCHRHLLSYALGTQQFSVSICCPCGSLTHIVNTCHLFHKP